MSAVEPAAARLVAVRRLGWALFGLSLAVVVVSAWLRLNAAGLGCAEWPACYGRVLVGEPGPQGGLMRALHRAGASFALVLAGILVWRSWRPQPLRPVAGHATVLLAVMLALAAIGIWSADPRRVGVGFVNILGGLALVSVSWRVVLGTRSSPAAPAGLLFKAGVAALAATVALGALIGARYAAVSCVELPLCAGSAWPPAGGQAAFNLLAVVDAAAPPGDAGGATLHLLHRYAALATLLLLGFAAHRAQRSPATRGPARWLLALLVIEIALGIATVFGGFPLWLAVAHGLGAAGLLAASAGFGRLAALEYPQ